MRSECFKCGELKELNVQNICSSCEEPIKIKTKILKGKNGKYLQRDLGNDVKLCWKVLNMTQEDWTDYQEAIIEEEW